MEATNHNISTIMDYDWREKAAAMTAADDNDVEKAFMDQAYGWVANKAGPLMQDPNRLGFEIVDKNDANTRMVGIFAFRINKGLLYVPVFFINGDIKGTDLLYVCRTKSFKPLNKGWVTFLLEKGDQNDGKGVSRDERRGMPQMVNFGQIANPPGRSKAAAYSEMLKEAGYDSWSDWAEAASTLTETEPVLRKFMLEDGGTKALALIEKAASESYDFTNALVAHCSEDDYAPTGLIDFTKKASVAPKLKLIVGSLPDGVKSASVDPDFFKRGFMLLDDRHDLDDELTTVMSDDTNTIEQFSGPGLYDVLMMDGSFSKAFVARPTKQSFTASGGGCCPAPCGDSPYYEQDVPSTDAIVVLVDGNKHKQCSDVLGKNLKDAKACDKKDGLLETMATGSCYRVFDTGEGTLSDPIYVTGKKTRKNITVYTAYTHWSTPIEIRHNPDYKGCDIRNNTLGSHAKFVKVDCDTEKCEHADEYRINNNGKFAVGNQDALEVWIRQSGVKKASVRKTNEGDYLFRMDGKTASDAMTAPGLAAFLSRDLAIPGKVAMAIVDQATESKRADMWLHIKKASAIKLTEDANFQTGNDPVFGTEVEFPQEFALNTEGGDETAPDSRIGDAWDPANADGLPGQILSDESPENIQQLAAMHKLPHVFEHGVVGSLANTFDSVAMIDKYLPDMEKALDSIGRIVFLFYWKPNEFEDAYGTDDMSNLENELLSNFKQFGDLVLNLSKKAKSRATGGSELQIGDQ